MSPAPAGVFINCPFDAGFQACQTALVLTVVAAGFQPRSALESGTTSVPRMRRIRDALRESPYSIHDLTRAYGDPKTALARFNMPFEFGMAFFFTEFASEVGGQHDWLALLPQAHPYGEYISDLAGYDLEKHDGTPTTIIPPVLAWLATRPDGPAVPAHVNPTAIEGLLPELELLLEAEQQKWGGLLPWSRMVEAARDLVGSRLQP